MIRLLAAAVMLSLCGTAYAQTQPRPRPPLTGNIIEDIRAGSQQGTTNAVAKAFQPLQELADILASDFAEAERLATAIPDLQDGNGQACWRVMASAGAVFKEHPLPATLRLATDIESVRLLFMTANKVCGSSACTQVFTDGANVVNALGPIPIMSLTGICSKIPQIASVPTTPPTAAPSTVTPKP